MAFRLLIINPGSTSTKIGVYEDEKQIFEKTLRHSAEEIGQFETIYSQKDFRKEVILNVLRENNFNINTLDAVVGRGGLLKPIPSGTYEVNKALLEDLKIGVQGPHASNLGGILAQEIAEQADVRAFIVDPVVVDELSDVARLSGVPELRRISIFHALNQKAVAKRLAKESGKKYEDLKLVVTHMGGGVSVGAHKYGRVIDVNNTLDGDGPFSPERAGGVPAGELIKMCFSGKYSKDEVYKKIVGKGGVVAYLGTNDIRDVEDMISKGDEKANLIYEAMVYQICKEIGAYATVLKGDVDAIILTGGIAYSKKIREEIESRVKFIAPVISYPGEDEMIALAQGGLRVLNGEEKALDYEKEALAY